jgi:hypothetical protein
MSIRSFTDEYDEPEEETTTSRWTYSPGTHVLWVEQISESLSLKVRTV